MRKLLSLMLAILISGVAFGQIQPKNVSKVLDQSKETKTSITKSNTQMGRVQRDIKTTHFANPDKAITGTFSLSPTTYIPGQTMILHFNITFLSPDLEWCDGISITFPTGMTPLEANTSTTIGSGSYVADLVTPISGNTVIWGQVTTPSGYGDIKPGSYDFQVAVAIDAGLTGQQSIVCYAMGDGYGATPHAINQTITMTEALDHDVAMTEILLNNKISTGSTVTPKAIISNVGLNSETVDLTFKINDGTGDVYSETVTGHDIASGSVDTITFSQNWPASTPGNYTATCYFTTTDDNTANDTLTKDFLVSDPIWGYAINAYDPDEIIPEGPVKVNLATGEIVPIGSNTVEDLIPGADFIRGDWYASNYDTESLITIDTTTGNLTTIGNIGLVMNGLAYDATTDKLYGCAYDGSASSILYEINYYTGTCTQVGTISAGIIIGIAANSHGNIYGINISDGSLYSIDKTTGAGTVIGALGYDINYAQDIAFDKDNDKLYGTLYATEGLLCEIDTTSGAVTVYNTTPCELTGLAFPYAYTLNENDIAVTNIDLPASGCDVSANNSITITLKNAGTMEQSNIPVSILINDDPLITETVAGPIASGATLDYTFTQNFDFSADGVYNIIVYASLSGDENPNNDTIHGVVNNYVSSQVPITIDFEDVSLHDRYTIVDNNGDDNTMFILNNATYAHSGSYSLAYGWSVTNPADDYFFSSCIDLEAGQSYKLSLWYRVRSASYPESFEVYLASGPSVAEIIGSPIISISDATNTTYAEATTANNVTVDNDGSYYIAIRATSAADMYYLYIDDIKIEKIYDKDIAVANIDLPTSGCDLSANSSITVTLKNEGALAQSDIPVNISINDGTPITETVAGPIASGATLDYTFSQNFDFSEDGVYNITVYSSLSGDENPNNDTMHGVVNNYAPATVPTTIDFEDISLFDRYTIIDNNGDGNTMFILNDPSYAHSGNYSLAYQYSATNPADDYFFSSCIDLTAGESYKLSLWYRVASASYPESFEVYLASDPSVAGVIGSPIISVPSATNITYEEATANNVTVDSDGSYYIAIRATSAADMYALFIDDITIDISDYIKENENNFNIYPNPANDVITINSNATMNQITIINSLGQVVMNVEPNTDFYQININTLPEGIYTARITTNNGLSTKLIVVAH